MWFRSPGGVLAAKIRQVWTVKPPTGAGSVCYVPVRGRQLTKSVLATLATKTFWSTYICYDELQALRSKENLKSAIIKTAI